MRREETSSEDSGAETWVNRKGHTDPKKKSGVQHLDNVVDYYRNFIVVSFAIVNAYIGLIGTEETGSWWSILLVGVAVIYILFLPYKRAVLIPGEMGIVARARVIRALYTGVSTWLVLWIWFSIDNSIINIFLDSLTLSNPEEYQALVVRPFILVVVVVGLAFAPSWKWISKQVGSEGIDIEGTSRYVGFHSFSKVSIVFFATFYAFTFTAAGWMGGIGRDESIGYFTNGIAYAVILLIYGTFFPWYIPERFQSRIRWILEGILLLAIFLSPQNSIVALIVFLVVIPAIYAAASSYPEPPITLIQEQVQTKKEEREKSLLEQVVGYFSEKHSKSSRIYFVVLFCSLLIILFALADNPAFTWLSLFVLIGGFILYAALAFIWMVFHVRQQQPNLTAK